MTALRVLHVDAPVRLHGRGEEPPQRPEEAEAEVAVLEREKREERMLSLRAEELQLEAGRHHLRRALGRHEIVHVDDVADVAGAYAIGPTPR